MEGGIEHLKKDKGKDPRAGKKRHQRRGAAGDRAAHRPAEAGQHDALEPRRWASARGWDSTVSQPSENIKYINVICAFLSAP